MRVDLAGSDVFIYTGAQPVVPGRRTVAFVHGAGMDHTVWVQQSRFFAHHGWNVLALDLPAHGNSGGVPLVSIRAMADWSVALLAACGIDSAVFVGHSMGALVALAAAATHPRRVSRLALLGVAVPMPVAKPLLDAARDNEHAAIDMITGWGHSLRGALGGNRAPGMWMTGGATRLLERARPGVLHADLAACDAWLDGLQSAASITCPTLLMLGSADQMTPPKAAASLRAALAQVEQVVLDGAGHMLMSEQPEAVLDGLRAFIER